MSFEKYSEDIAKLIKTGGKLYGTMVIEVYPEEKKKLKLTDKQLKDLPTFASLYQPWYSESVACIRQLLPDRLDDFISYYKPPKLRKEITYSGYTISDYLKGLTVTSSWENKKLVGREAALPSMRQQLEIVKAIEQRFQSSLFDIRTLVQADMFDSELDAAEELSGKGFYRGAGAIAGVVLEGHLRSVCGNHKVSAPKNATLGKLNDILKDKGVIDMVPWRFNQHLIDIRDLCGHKSKVDPDKDSVNDLISGVRKVTKTLF